MHRRIQERLPEMAADDGDLERMAIEQTGKLNTHNSPCSRDAPSITLAPDGQDLLLLLRRQASQQRAKLPPMSFPGGAPYQACRLHCGFGPETRSRR